jgi:hypothetical protein
MATSQNGYLANRRDLTAVYTVPGTSVKLRLRKGPVAAVLVEVARRFHTEVEPIDAGTVTDDWSYAERPIRGSTTTLSNHASGTAIDLNALRHPRGVHGTFTPAQKTAVRRILDDLRDPATGRRTVRWGEDYSTVVDGMHFEIDDDPDAVARVAHAIQEDDDMTPEQLAAAVAAGVAAANSAASVPVTRSGKQTARSILTILSNLDHAGYGALPPSDRVLLESAAEQVKTLTEQVKALTAATDQIRSRLGTPDQTE